MSMAESPDRRARKAEATRRRILDAARDVGQVLVALAAAIFGAAGLVRRRKAPLEGFAHSGGSFLAPDADGASEATNLGVLAHVWTQVVDRDPLVWRSWR